MNYRNIYCYRLPEDTVKHKYIGRIMLKVNHIPSEKGFLFAPFIYDGSLRFILQKNPIANIPEEIVRQNALNITDRHTTNKTEYRKYIQEIKEIIGNKVDRKIVSSRRLCINLNKSIDTDSLFEKLCNVYPDAFVYFISTPEFGNWIGATPELLLKRCGKCYESAALAGTVARNVVIGWDEKNREEQQIVTDYISQVFNVNGITKIKFSKGEKSAGPVKHILTQIVGSGKEIDDYKLLTDLYPTPALSGFPKHDSIKVILNNERDGRGLYGGFCGPVSDGRNYNLFVILRCMSFTQERLELFAGGGITSKSDFEEEWNETENKFSTLLNILEIS